MRKLKVLLSAYTCCPGRGSEPGVGWNFSSHMARYHDVWVLTQSIYRPFIEKELASNPIPQLRFVYYDLPPWAHKWWHHNQRGIQLYYYLWQLGVYHVARRLHREVSFDLSQHVTFGRYWSPSLIALLPIPFILGPVGGGESAPKSFRADFGMRGAIYEYARDVAQFIGECDPLVKMTLRRASVILAPTRDTRTRLEHLGSKRIRSFPGQTGLNEQECEALGVMVESPATKIFRFISISRLLHWKGIHLGIRAFAAANVGDAEYWIIGEGPERDRLQKLAENLKVSSRVKFMGDLPRRETFLQLRTSDVLVHLSLHDFSPTVCLEAMAASRPIICLDIGGPSMQITKETGLRITALTPKQVISDVAGAMESMARNPTMCLDMGQAGRRRAVSEYSWSKKAELLDLLYREVVQGTETVA